MTLKSRATKSFILMLSIMKTRHASRKHADYTRTTQTFRHCVACRKAPLTISYISHTIDPEIIAKEKTNNFNFCWYVNTSL